MVTELNIQIGRQFRKVTKELKSMKLKSKILKLKKVIRGL